MRPRRGDHLGALYSRSSCWLSTLQQIISNGSFHLLKKLLMPHCEKRWKLLVGGEQTAMSVLQ
jgi:hypothetical protein